jgi:hypothetical protein
VFAPPALLHCAFVSLTGAMHSLTLYPSSATDTPVDLEAEGARLGALLAARRAELTALQEGLRAFKARYTQTVGGRLAELAEVEREIEEAETRLLGLDEEEEDAGDGEEAGTSFSERGGSEPTHVRASLRQLFWSVAKMFHPDHAADDAEARRRHTVMAEASRAYREGDVESLHTLLGDDALQSFCASARGADEEEDPGGRVLALELELRTIEFGIKRARQDGLYRLKLEVEEEARAGRDALAQMAERIQRQIAKARRRLAHLS